MHIPSAPTTELAVLDFDRALSQSGKTGDYDSADWLYVPDFYTEYRYLLGTRGAHPLICIGVNPSTAAPNALDNTLKSVERIALHNGFDSFLMLNVYAQRATRPQDMDRQCNQTLHRQNLLALDHALCLCAGAAPPSVWAAWGNLIEMRKYLPQCVADMIAIGETHHALWFTAGQRSKRGHPHHPLYLKKDSALDLFDVREYCSTVLK